MSRPFDLAVLGLGAMGTRMAANAAAAGHAVTVWNRSDATTRQVIAGYPALHAQSSAMKAAAEADTVLVMVTDDIASRSIWQDERVLDAVDEGTVAVDASTLSPAWTTELSDRVDAASARFLAAPVLGSTPQADAGQLVQLVGGPTAALEAVRPLLDASAVRVLHVGAPADAAIRKLVVNGWLAGQVALVGELVGHLERSGLPRAEAASFLRDLPLTSPALAGVLDRVAVDEADPRFPIRLVAKDMRYLQDAAGTVPLLKAIADAWSDASARHGHVDIAGYIRTVADREG